MALPELKKKSSGIFYVDLRSRGLGRVSLETRDRAVAVEKRRELLATPPSPSRLSSHAIRDLRLPCVSYSTAQS